MLNIISLGAGVQSSTMALMAAHGEITPTPDAAIFADVGDEPTNVYEWLDYLESIITNPLRVDHPFPVYRVKHKSGLSLSAVAPRLKLAKTSGNTYLEDMIPAYLKGADGHIGMSPRHCTKTFKVNTVRRKTRELLGGKTPAGAVHMWIGISTDEAQRMKPAPVKYIINKWPLVEMGISRQDCFRWMEKAGYPRPPRSSCVFCPFHSNSEWRHLKENDPASFQKAVDFEKVYSAAISKATSLHATAAFLHKSGVPLDQADFTDGDPNQLDMFGNECEGMCGV
jgi:hypothetical protein